MAEYGGFRDRKIFDYTNDADCSLPSANIVKSQCDGEISCNMNVDSSLFRNDPCPGKDKQLYMEYVCVDSLATPITIGKLCFFLRKTWTKLTVLLQSKMKFQVRA